MHMFRGQQRLRASKGRAALLGALGALVGAFAIATTPMLASADSDVDIPFYFGQTQCLTPVQLVGGSGTFCYSATICFMFSSDDIPPFETCGLSASGSYTNTVCGTGSASGTANVSEASGGFDTFGFSITFAAGVGVVTGGQDGVVDIIPTGPGSPPATCVNSFTVIGVGVTP